MSTRVQGSAGRGCTIAPQLSVPTSVEACELNYMCRDMRSVFNPRESVSKQAVYWVQSTEVCAAKAPRPGACDSRCVAEAKPTSASSGSLTEGNWQSTWMLI